jgi:hypothetical protein
MQFGREMDGTARILYPVVGFGLSLVEFLRFSTTVLVSGKMVGVYILKIIIYLFHQ